MGALPFVTAFIEIADEHDLFRDCQGFELALKFTINCFCKVANFHRLAFLFRPA